MNLDKEVFEISLNDIIPNRFQPREIFNDAELKELSDSIREHGVIQPIIVRKVGDKYEIIAGERRFRASRLAGKETIPALVRDIDDREAAKIALLENLQRSNLTPIEEAKTYQTILKIDNITQEELAKSLGKTQGTIANKIRLLSLAEDVQTALLNSQISERHARSLLSLPVSEQSNMLQRIINEKLTVRQLDEEIQKITGKAPELVVDDSTSEETIAPSQPTIPEFAMPSPNFDIPRPEVNINNDPNMNQNAPTTETNTNETAVLETKEKPVIENFKPIIEEHPIMPTANAAEPVLPKEESIEQPIVENQISSSIEETSENNEPQERPFNIFDRLRVQPEERPINDIPTPPAADIVNNVVEEQTNNPNEIYDLRFAINNFRQAVQNTEKFGFKVKSSEYDSPTKYQFVIEIDK